MMEYEDNVDAGGGANYAGALKCAFHEPKGELKGEFCAIMHNGDARVVEIMFWTTKSDSYSEVPTSLPWEEFSTKLPEIGQLEKESTDKLRRIVSDRLSPERISVLFSNHSEVAVLSDEIKIKFEDTLHYEVSVQMVFEPFSKERLQASGYERESDSSSAQGIKMSDIVKDHAADVQTIPCMPKIDPVHGVPSSELKVGDMLEITVPTNTSAGKLIADYYAGRGEEPLFPIEKIESTDSGASIIILNAGGGILCSVKTNSDIRLKGKKFSLDNVGVLGLAQRTMIIGGIVAVIVIVGLVAAIFQLLK